MENIKIIDSIYSCSSAKYFNVDKTSYLYKNVEKSATSIINNLNIDYYFIKKKSILKSIILLCWYNLKIKIKKINLMIFKIKYIVKTIT